MKAFMEYRAKITVQAGDNVEIAYRREKINPADIHHDPRFTRIIAGHVAGVYEDLVAGRVPELKPIGALITD
jgi:hypothetical protein